MQGPEHRSQAVYYWIHAQDLELSKLLNYGVFCLLVITLFNDICYLISKSKINVWSSICLIYIFTVSDSIFLYLKVLAMSHKQTEYNYNLLNLQKFQVIYIYLNYCDVCIICSLLCVFFQYFISYILVFTLFESCLPRLLF